MGDSITDGVPVAGGYRDPLYTLLNARGDSFTFIGSAANIATATLTSAGQTRHEGHSGYVIAAGGGRTGLDENLAGWIGPGAESPDRILLMIGSNDINIAYDMANAPARLSTLITHIHGYRPGVKLYVASIIPMSGHESDVRVFNTAIPGIVASHKTLGQDVVYVPMYESLNINTDLADGLHPNALGYQHNQVNGSIPTPAFGGGGVTVAGQAVHCIGIHHSWVPEGCAFRHPPSCQPPALFVAHHPHTKARHIFMPFSVRSGHWHTDCTDRQPGHMDAKKDTLLGAS
jgi:lysophospholipase L1-like esterase